ncbi:hypothetical protein ES703_107877 [subsurface metagenome]
MINNRPIHTLDWHISGGGGGSLSRKYDHQKLEYAEELYNNRLESTGNQEMSIKINNDVVKLEYNFLVVHSGHFWKKDVNYDGLIFFCTKYA